MYTDGVNQAARRKPGQEQNWVAPGWGWAWPANRRIIYNRASADPDGKPWSPRKALVWWDDEEGKWTGHDIPDFASTKSPWHRPPAGATAAEALGGDDPFIMQADGKAWLYVPAGLTDGPLPTHYEPQDSPFPNLLYPQQRNPVRQVFSRPHNRYHPDPGQPGSEVFPYAITTYRLTEHHTAGGMSRWLPYLSELQPEMFCEVSPELAAERGLRAPGLGHDRDRARRDRGPRAGNRADHPAAGAGPHPAPDRAALPLGPERLHPGRRGQRAGVDRAGS